MLKLMSTSLAQILGSLSGNHNVGPHQRQPVSEEPSRLMILQHLRLHFVSLASYNHFCRPMQLQKTLQEHLPVEKW